MKALLKWVQDEVISWWNEQTLMRKVIISLLVIMIIFLCFKYPDPTRNLILFIAGLTGLYFLNRRTITAEQNTEAAEQSAEAIRQNAVTAEKGLTAERLTRAIDQLTHEKTATRLGGILGLEQIALTQKEESQKIARILATFIRTRAAKDSDETKKEIAASGVSKLEPGDDFSKYRVQRLDVEVAVHTLANIASELEKRGEFQEFLQYNKSKQDLCDLRDIDLRGLQLNKVNFSNFNLIGTDFSYAWLAEANFTKAGLFFPFSPILKEENKTKFIGAILESSNFSDTQLNHVDFSSSILVFANFDKADLGHAIFDGCQINHTYFETSRNLTQEQINKAFYLDDNLIPFLPKGLNLPRPLTTGTPSRSEGDKPPTRSDN